jgi:NAD(P)-dependent dehydrogenase (short-subunit alcohol dehydrogenase family)
VFYPLAATQPAEMAIDDDSVVVAVGGARGITAAVLLALAQRCRPRMWLLGTSELAAHAPGAVAVARGATLADILRSRPGIGVRSAALALSAERSAAETASTIHRLRALCGADRVNYLRCDVTDPDATAAAADSIYTADGAVDLLIHAAGITRTRLVRDKSLADFRLVRDCKLLGYHNLKRAFAGRPPRRWCNFGSVIGAIGAAGETDYAAANEFLAAAALSELTRSPFDAPVVAWLGDREIRSFAAHVPGIVRTSTPPETDRRRHESPQTP